MKEKTQNRPLARPGVSADGAAPGGSCLVCGGKDISPVAAFSDVPTQATMILRSAEEASSFPRADMAIGFCETCGLIGNTRFDASLLHYGDGFEESQFASATFRAFARDLATRLVGEVDTSKPFVELGCGKGEFLELLCEIGGGRGVGIDPACEPGRIDAGLRDRIEIVREFYDEAHAGIVSGSSLVCCRHTLEHLGDPVGFLSLLRSHLEGRPETLVYVDVPDTDHVIDDGAFWEMNYEHCAYYTPATVARTLERAGFAVREVGVEYGGQNLYAKATSGSSPGVVIPTADDPRVRAMLLSENIERATTRWASALRGRGGTALWGSGSRAVGFMGATGLGEAEIDAVVDINEKRQGMYMPGYGRAIVSPAELVSVSPERVVVMNPMYVDEIRAELGRLGLSPEVYAINEPPETS